MWNVRKRKRDNVNRQSAGHECVTKIVYSLLFSIVEKSSRTHNRIIKFTNCHSIQMQSHFLIALYGENATESTDIIVI